MSMSGISLWRQISQSIATDIERGKLRGGERLPTDGEVAHRFGVNRHTARRAISHLELEGLVRIERGRGTFVVEGVLEYQLGAQTRFTQNLLDNRRSPRRKVIRSEELPASANVAEGLKIPVGEPCVLLVLLGEADEVPLSLGLNYFPLRRLPGLSEAITRRLAKDVEALSITDLLRTAGVKTYERRQTKIGARMPTAEEAGYLRMARTQPLLETESLDVDPDELPVTYARTCFRADRLQLVVPT